MRNRWNHPSPFARLLLALTLILAACPEPSKADDLREGDIIFHTSRSAQSTAISLATGSRYTHMGILFKKDGKLQVLEAVQPVRYTPLAAWISRGEGGRYVVKRLRDAERLLTPAAMQRLRAEAESFLGRKYDVYFGWSDERIYCSELVWKAYRRALGIEIGDLQRLEEFDLTHEAVKQKLKERYGDSIPLDEQVISPGAMFESEELIEVMSR